MLNSNNSEVKQDISSSINQLRKALKTLSNILPFDIVLKNSLLKIDSALYDINRTIKKSNLSSEAIHNLKIVIDNSAQTIESYNTFDEFFGKPPLLQSIIYLAKELEIILPCSCEIKSLAKLSLIEELDPVSISCTESLEEIQREIDFSDESEFFAEPEIDNLEEVQIYNVKSIITSL